MPIALDVVETQCILRLDGDIDIACSGELKAMIIEALSTHRPVVVDLAGATDLDVTAMQVLWAAARDAERSGISFVAAVVPEMIAFTVREAGFEAFPVPMTPVVEHADSRPVENDDD